MSIKLRIRNLENRMKAKTIEHRISLIPDKGIFRNGVKSTQVENELFSKFNQIDKCFTSINILYYAVNPI